MAYSFNGSTQYLGVSSNPITAYPFTMVGWFNTAVTTGTLTIAYQGSTLANSQGLTLSAGKVAASTTVAGQGTASATTTASYSTSQWQHAAGVWTAATDRAVFLNGSNKVTNTTSRLYSSTTTILDVGSFFFNNARGGYFNGQIAEVAIWNAALSDAEIASLAAGFTPDQVRPQSLQFYSPLVRNLIDVRSGLVITNNNSAAVVAHPRVIT